MGKRKASIFTVAESVSNWLDASCRIPEHIEFVAGETVQLGTGLNIATPVGLNQPTVVPAKANQFTQSPSPLATDPDCGLASGSREELAADVASPLQTSKESV